MTKAIPEAQRSAVKVRDRLKCCRCGTPTRHGQWHHRRGRRVKDDHTHCTCNGVWLCDPCHDWVHEHPFESRALGFIVLRSEPYPFEVPIHAAQHGLVRLTCEQTVITVEEQ